MGEGAPQSPMAGHNDRSKEAIGALSRISDDVVRNALTIPRQGRVFDLGLELNSGIPHNPEFVRFAMAFTHTPEGTGALSPFQYSVELIFGPLHIGTHIDFLFTSRRRDASTGAIWQANRETIAAGRDMASRPFHQYWAEQSVSTYRGSRASADLRTAMR